MRYLLDTNILLWYIDGDKKLPAKIKDIITSNENELFVSVASIWEIAIKSSIGQLELRPDIHTFLNTYVQNENYTILPIEAEHAKHVATLPFHHRDPFDRLIYAQSVVENIEFLYTDVVFKKYLKDNK